MAHEIGALAPVKLVEEVLEILVRRHLEALQGDKFLNFCEVLVHDLGISYGKFYY